MNNINKNYKSLLILIIILLSYTFIIQCSEIVVASTVSSSIKSITDDVDLFNTQQEANLSEMIKNVKDEYDVDIFILTRNNIIGTKQRYMDTFVSSNDAYINDAVLLLINMDSNDRGVQIQGYGSCNSMINNNRVELILDKIVPALSNANYYNAMQEFIEQVEKYVKKGEPTKLALALDNIPHMQNLIVAIVISAIIVGILVYKSEGRVTTNHATYSQNGKILGRQDRYTHTTTTRVRKPQNEGGSGGGMRGSGGGGGGGRSSGGRSF